MIRILTDSACDILPAEAQQLGVTVIPLNVTLEDGTVLRDGIDMTPSEYYTHLAACRKLPTTSQPSPEQFERLYLDAAAAGDGDPADGGISEQGRGAESDSGEWFAVSGMRRGNSF